MSEKQNDGFPETPDFLRVEQQEKQTVIHVDHKEWQGSLRIKPPTFRLRLETAKIKAMYLCDTSSLGEALDADAYAHVALFFEAVKGEAFRADTVEDTQLIFSLYWEIQRFLARRQAV